MTASPQKACEQTESRYNIDQALKGTKNQYNKHYENHLKHLNTVPSDGYRSPSTRQILQKYGYSLLNGPKIGYGRYSKVCQGLHGKSSRKIAIKIIDTKNVTQEYKSKFLPREVHAWNRLRHDNLVALYSMFEDTGKVFLIMELAEKGDLLSYVQLSGAQPESQAQIWMRQLISAVKFMHSKSVAHRDLKLENILLFANHTVKIADFGFCREAKEYDLSLTFCGSKSYSAPEILLGHAYSPFKADIWSLGVVAFVLVTNRMPYNERVASNSIIVDAQRNRSYRYSKRLTLSQACQATIDTMMTFDYRARPDIYQVKKLPWFTDCLTFNKHQSSSSSSSNSSQQRVAPSTCTTA